MTIIVSGVGLVGFGVRDGRGAAGLLPSALTVGEEPSPAPSGPSPEELAAKERRQRVDRLDAALKKVAADAPEFAVAVLDARTGARYSFRGAATFDTASIVKVEVLTCLLLQAQDEDRDLTEGETALAEPMIRKSDNDATSELFERVGGRVAITRCNERLGLTETVVNAAWGLTKTTADDQVTLLSELVDAEGPLDADSRRTAFLMMNTVVESQQWGVPRLAESGETATVKNGWDTRTADSGLWAVNSIGRLVSADEHTDVSIAILSHDNSSMSNGITLVENVAELTRRYLEF
ncbi:serine hydrolase [Actinoplanes sp. NPDC051859]|uniref:serine hydrolase n=1 Tax=Actinoplanes sp. NPDC051859 TaxID=3363909 RepID=UPI0037BDDE47